MADYSNNSANMGDQNSSNLDLSMNPNYVHGK
jgi:hypothetical protein